MRYSRLIRSRSPRRDRVSQRRLTVLGLATVLALLLSLFPQLAGAPVPTASAHNLQTKMVYMFFDRSTQTLLDNRVAGGWTPGNPILQAGDTIGMIIKVVPRDGTTTGVGGHVDFYVPSGTTVVDAAYMVPDGSGGFIPAAMKGQSPIAVGDGPIGAKSTSQLVGWNVTLTSTASGISAQPVVPAAGLHRGTIAGVYGDTGIFYSTDPDTAYGSWQKFTGDWNSSNIFANRCGLTSAIPAPNGKSLTNNSGDVFVPCNKWDAEQVFAWGVKGTSYTGSGATSIPIVDYGDGRGNAPWGFASGVAGPQSGYAWFFDWDEWRGKPTPRTAADMQAAMDTMGPWQRIKYNGSRISYDQPGLTSTVLGYASTDGSGLGATLPLSATLSQIDSTSPKSIRWAVGQLTAYRPEYVYVKLQVDQPNGSFLDASGCPVFHSDTFGGDAGGTDNGKDHLWRYYEPSEYTWNGCLAVGKQGSAEFVQVGQNFSYNLRVYNLGTTPQTNVVVKDTLPSGIAFISATPAQSSGPNPLVWNVGTLQPNQYFQATLNVKATATGYLDNCVTVTSDQGTQSSCDTTIGGAYPYLIPTKSVTPATITPGGTITYTLTVNNIGSGASGSPLTLDEYLPAGFTYQALVSTTVNGAAVTPTVNAANPNQPVFTVPGPIQAGKALVLTFTAQVGSNVPGGSYCNTYRVTNNGVPVTTGSQACVTVGAGTIGDTIFRDWNGNGVQDSVDEGLQGVTVNLYAGACLPSGNPIQTKVTTASGGYLFAGLNTPGSFCVDPVAPVSYTLTTPPDPRTITLAQNQTVLTADFGFQPGGAGKIGDQVFDDQNNDGVFNGADAGINGVTVRLYEDTNGNGIVEPAQDYLVGTTTTAGGGFYQFTGLDPTRSYVVAADDGAGSGVDGYFTTAYSSSTGNPQLVKPADFTAQGNNVTDADFGYFGLAPGSIGDQVFADINGDGVFSPTIDTPLANVTVMLYRDANGDGQPQPGELVITTTTGVTGTYTFANLGPDTYIVAVDESDPDVPGGYVSTVGHYDVMLAGGQNVTYADFPFVPLIQKTVSPTSVASVPATLTYTITVNYPTEQLLSGVVVTDAIPTGTTYVANSINASGYYTDTPEAGGPAQVVWELGDNLADVPGYAAGAGKAYCPVVLNAPVLADTFIIKEKPNNNNGGNTLLITRPADANRLKYALVKFDVSSIPAGAVIQSAYLGMNVQSARATNHNDQVYRLKTAWTEGAGTDDACTGAGIGGATWNAPNCTDTWAGGAAFSATDYYTTTLGTIAPKTKGYKTVNVASAVNAWVNGGATNHGLVLVSTGRDGGDAKYYNRENTTANTDPYLKITYLVATTGGCSGPTVLDAIADTYIDRTKATENYGADVVMKTKKGTQVDQASLIRFDLGAVPADAAIASAVLTATITSGSANGEYDNVHVMQTPWVEGAGVGAVTNDGATWNTRNGVNSWASGGVFSTSDYYTTSLGTITQAGNDLPYTVTATSAVTGWLQGGVANNGLALIPGVNGGVDYVTREATGADANKQAKLQVNWTLAPNPGAATTTRLKASPMLLGSTGLIRITMEITASATVTNVTPPANLGFFSGVGGVSAAQANATKISGPSPATPITVTAGSVGTFTWVYQVSPGPEPEGVYFTGKPTATGTQFATANSNSVLVVPTLTFQVRADSLPASGFVTNTAHLSESSVPTDVESNEATTAFGGNIGDRVWADLDGDGQQDAGEPGVPNVQVCATPTAGGAAVCATTDAAGSYRIYGLTNSASYTVALSLATMPAGYLPTTSTSLSNVIASTNSADFGIRPPGRGIIGDTVWIDANEDGAVDAGESGLPNITVKLYDSAGTNLLATTTTDASGIYTFTGVYSGTYKVLVDTSSAITSPYGVATTLAAAMDLVSVAGNTSPLDNPLTVVVPSDTASVLTADFGFNWGGSIGDTVWWDSNRDGSPTDEAGIPDAIVLLYFDANGNGVLDQINGDYQVGFKTTDANGNYLFDNLPPGKYLVDVYEDSITTNGIRNVVPTTLDVVAKTLAGNEDYLAADFGYYRGAKVEGNVFWDENHNGVLDLSERDGAHLLASVAVTITCAGNDGVLGTGDDFTTNKDTDASGHYAFIVPAGLCTVSYDTGDPQIPAALGDQTTPVSYTFTAVAGEDWHPSFDFGRDNTGVIGDTVWNDGDPLGTTGVQDAGEAGLANVTVNLVKDVNNDNLWDPDGLDNFPGTADDEVVLATQVTDANGNYRFVGLADGNYLAVVNAATLPTDFGATWDNSGGLDGIGQADISGGNSVLTVDFGYKYAPPGGTSLFTISGRVYNDQNNNGADNGEPGFSGVSVTVVCNFGTFVVPTSGTGAWKVTGIPVNSTCTVLDADETDLPRSDYVGTQAPGAPITVTGDILGLDFGYYQTPASISGTVCAASDGDGICEAGEAPIDGVTVTLTWAGPDGILSTADDQTFITTTQASLITPTYTFTNLQPGLYQIVETNPLGYTTMADRDGGNPDNITVFNLGIGENLGGQDFEDAPPPGFDISKVLTAPVSGVAAVSNTITFTIRITNSGVTSLPSLTITDTYDANYLTLTSHSITPDRATPGIITWTNSLAPFLPLLAGQSLTITVDFHADRATDETINTVEASAEDQLGEPIGPKMAADDVQIVRPAIGIAKSVAAVTNNGGGSYTVIYDMTVENLGDQPLSGVQVTDNLLATFTGAFGFTVNGVASTGFAVNPLYNGIGDTNLLAANQTLAVGEVKHIQLTVTVTPDLSKTYNNQPVASGTSPQGFTVTDLSDNGVDPDPDGDGNANEAGENDPTPVNFNESPAIGVAKSVATVKNNGSNYTVSYMLVVQNLGNVNLSNVQVTDDLNATFAPTATFTVQSLSSTGFTVNWPPDPAPNYNGSSDTNLLAAGQTLAVGQSKIILVTATITTTNLGPYLNQAVASGTSPANTAVSDLSDNGLVPDPNGNGNANEPGENDPTPVNLTESPAIGVAKRAFSTTNNGDGTYTVVYDILVQNLGSVTLSNVQVKDNLATTFAGATSFLVQGPPVITAGTLISNTLYNGATDIRLLAGTNTLAPGASGTIRVTVLVTPGSNLGPYNNQAVAEGVSPAGTTVSDLSDDSATLNPDPNGNSNANEPGENDPTPVTFAEHPVIGVAKSVVAVTNNQNGTYTVIYDLVVENLGDVILNNVQVTDTLAATFPPPATFIANSWTSPSFAVNPGYNGSADAKLLAANQTLGIGQVKTIRLTVTVTPAPNLGPYYNQVIATGVSPAGAHPTDLSDNGIDPDPTGDGNPATPGGNEDDPTPVLFSESPAIGLAKSVGAVISLGAGVYDVIYNIVVQNLGNVPLGNLQVTDSLSATFAPTATFTVQSVTSLPPPLGLAVNPGYNGSTNTNLVVAGQTLAAGQIVSIQVRVRVTTGANLGPFNNQAVGVGTSPAGTVVSDLSDSGINPDPDGDNNANEPGENDPTPVRFTENPAIGAAKRLVSTTANLDGSYTVVYDILARNLGNQSLTNVQVSDDLVAAFAGSAGFAVQGPPVITAGTLTANAGYNGLTDVDLLASGQTLALGGSVTIQITVKVIPAGFLGPYNNQAAATGTSPAGTTVGDLSDDSATLNPDPNSNGNPSEPGENDPTPVTFTENPMLGVAKELNFSTSNGNGSFTVAYTITVKNYGNVVIKNLQVADSLTATFPAPATFTVLSLTSPDFTEKTVGAGGYTGTPPNHYLLAGTDTLGMGASGVIAFTVVVTPNVTSATYNNQAVGTGTSPAGAAVSDQSQVGANPDPDDDHNPTNNNAPTPVTLTENAVLGVAKQVVGTPTNNGDGTFTVVYGLFVKNYGNVVIHNLQVTDNLDLTFGPGKYTVTNLASAEFAENWPAGYNGSTNTQLLLGTDTLAVSGSGTITFTAVVTPGSNLGPYDNQATGAGASPAGTPVSDLSQDGPNPDPDGDGPGDDSDKTPVRFDENPKIGLAKAVKSNTHTGNGTFTVAYTLTVKNYGDVEVRHLQVLDNLDATFGAGKYTVTGLSSADFAVNWPAGYNGSTNINLLKATDTLPVNATGTIVLTVTVTPGVSSATYLNIATVIGSSPAGSAVTDQSQNGLDPDPGSPPDGDPTNNNEPTPVSYAEHPAIGLAKRLVGAPVNNGDGTHDVTYEILVQNIGDVVLRQLQVTDDLSATFGAPATFITLSVSSAKFTVNGNYTGIPPAPGINLLAGADSLAAGDQGAITLVVRVNPDGFAGPYNNLATGAGTSPGGVKVTDISQVGVDPDPGSPGNTPADNGNAGQYNDPTPVSFDIGAIGDKVWWDANGDGQQMGEPGIPGVTVNLLTAGGSVITSTVTDASGNYKFANLAPDTYTVQIDPSEFAPGGTLEGWNATLQDVGPDATDSDGHPTTHTASVTVTAGMSNMTIDFGFTRASSYTITKELNTPEPVRSGAEISFTIRITNTGDSWIAFLPLQDTYNTTFLTYGFGSKFSTPQSESQATTGTIDWSDLTQAGPKGFGTDLEPGHSFTVTVYFTAREDTSSLPNRQTINTATVHGAYVDPDGDGPTPASSLSELPEQSASDGVYILRATGIGVASFTGTRAGSQVNLAWLTANEASIAGFYVARQAADGGWVRLNAELIFAQYAGAAQGGAYEFADADLPAGPLVYRLEVVGLDGNISQAGVVEVSGQ